MGESRAKASKFAAIHAVQPQVPPEHVIDVSGSAEIDEGADPCPRAQAFTLSATTDWRSWPSGTSRHRMRTGAGCPTAAFTALSYASPSGPPQGRGPAGAGTDAARSARIAPVPLVTRRLPHLIAPLHVPEPLMTTAQRPGGSEGQRSRRASTGRYLWPSRARGHGPARPAPPRRAGITPCRGLRASRSPRRPPPRPDASGRVPCARYSGPPSSRRRCASTT